MTTALREALNKAARDNGNKHGKVAELDFGAGAEWMFDYLMKNVIRQAYKSGYEKGHYDTVEGSFSPEESAEDFNIEDIE